MNEPSDRDDRSSPGPYPREISAGAERARRQVREEFEHFRVGIEKLGTEESDAGVPLFALSGDGPPFAVDDGAERARAQVREEFDELREGIEKSLRVSDGDGPSTG